MRQTKRQWRDVLDEHTSVVSGMETAGETLDAIADAIIACFRAGRRLYILGNGGSAADAQHITAELVGRFKRDRRPLPAIALTANTSSLTAIGNDLGFDEVFARQVEALVQQGDMAWLISTSGKSPNILAAARAAADRGAVVISFTGQTGGELAGLCTHAFRAPHSSADRIQEAHGLAYHYVCERIEAAFA